MEFLTWYESIDIDCKVFVPGNHDTSWEKGMIHATQFKTIDILVNESITYQKGINGKPLHIWGSPITPSFGQGWAYNCSRTSIDKYWKQIPKDTDIVVTHGPPKGVRDITVYSNGYYEQVGCASLLNAIKIIKPKIHCYGHVHDENSVYNYGISQRWGTNFVNASLCNLRYDLINEPIIIDI